MKANVGSNFWLFLGDDSLFMVIFSMEVDNGFLATSLPAELINTTEIRTMNSYQWQPLQTYVTISHHFTVKANGIRFRGTINDCNSVMKQLFYYVSSFASNFMISLSLDKQFLAPWSIEYKILVLI